MSNDIDNNNDHLPMPEQLQYANLLSIGAWAGIIVMIITYIIYVMGIMPTHVDIVTVTKYWHLNVHDYLEVTNSPAGWGWLGLIGKGDYLNFLGIAWLAVLTIVCYAVLLPGYLKRKDMIYAGIVVVEILVLCLAASGIVGGGGH
jgi:hypothetical protein